MNPLHRALIEMAGHDNGFEHVVTSSPDGVVLASARHAAIAQVVEQPSGDYLMSLRVETPALLPEMRRSFAAQAQANGFAAGTIARLASMLRRAAGLARALPSQAANDYEATVTSQLAQLPADSSRTEVERLVRQRVGQQKFREAMLDYWGGACAVTGVTLPEVLRASHAKPWAECTTDSERLDVFNGFLLVANLDALFDRFLISFDDDGELLMSPTLPGEVRNQLGLHPGLTLRWLSNSHRVYLAGHRARFHATLT